MSFRDAVPYLACSGCHSLLDEVLALITLGGRVGVSETKLFGAVSTFGAPASVEAATLLERATAGTAAIVTAAMPMAIPVASSGLRMLTGSLIWSLAVGTGGADGMLAARAGTTNP
jgi:hypothetical protein